MIGINLSICTNTSIPHQINFKGKLEKKWYKNKFIAEKQQKNILNFL